MLWVEGLSFGLSRGFVYYTMQRLGIMKNSLYFVTNNFEARKVLQILIPL